MTRFKDLTPWQKRFSVLVLIVALPLIAAAQRDLNHRRATELRGPKLMWRVVCLNGLGALVYLKWGRRPPASRTSLAAG